MSLTLSNSLRQSSLKNHPEIHRVTKDIFCCSLRCFVNSSGHVLKTGDKCRSKFCHTCNRRRSALLQSRLNTIVRDKFSDLSTYRFYLLTITMKHREGDYLKELKGFQNKLFRCKYFKDTFGEYGMIQGYENKIKESGYHIHSHNLIICNRITTPINRIQKQLSTKWHRITGDSKVLALDLLGKGIDWRTDPGSIFRMSKEVLKYATKIEDYRSISPAMREQIASWVVSSKGKNFTNARGTLRGLGITALKSDVDDQDGYDPNDWYDPDETLICTRTGKIKYNESVRHSAQWIRDKDILSSVEAVQLGTESYDVSGIADRVAPYLGLFPSTGDESDFKKIIDEKRDEFEQSKKRSFEFDSGRSSSVIQSSLFV